LRTIKAAEGMGQCRCGAWIVRVPFGFGRWAKGLRHSPQGRDRELGEEACGSFAAQCTAASISG
jgi:hypothetical protein